MAVSWNDYRRRGETLRAVIEYADTARDGIVPMDVPGVRDNFADELDLVASLLLRWHSRLSGNLERALMAQPMSLENAVADAWAHTAEQMPGVRAIVDRCTEHPENPAMAEALDRARRREWTQLALAAGAASSAGDPRAVLAGRRIEMQARAATSPAETPPSPAPITEELLVAEPVEQTEAVEAAQPRPDFVQRLRAALVA